MSTLTRFLSSKGITNASSDEDESSLCQMSRTRRITSATKKGDERKVAPFFFHFQQMKTTIKELKALQLIKSKENCIKIMLKCKSMKNSYQYRKDYNILLI